MMSCERNVAASPRGGQRGPALLVGAALWCATALLAPTAGAQTFDGTFTADDELAFFTFTVGTDDVNVFTTSWIGGNGESETSGFDPVLTFFTAEGLFYASVTMASEGGSRNPDFFFSGAEESGTYIAVLSQYDNLSVASQQEGDGTLDDGFVRQGQPDFTSLECFEEVGERFWQIFGLDCIFATGSYEVVFSGVESVQRGLPPASTNCPNEANPFGGGGSDETGQTAIVYAGSEWPGCASPVKFLQAGPNSIELFATGGNDPSDPAGLAPCTSLDGKPGEGLITANGQEICGIDFVIEITTVPGYFTGFDPDPAFSGDAAGRSITVHPSEFGPGVQKIRVVALATGAPLAEPFYHRMGRVDVFAPDGTRVEVVTKSGAGSSFSAANEAEGTGAVKADLEAVPLINNFVGVPEPGVWLQLPAALAGLAVLARLRQRRRR